MRFTVTLSVLLIALGSTCGGQTTPLKVADPIASTAPQLSEKSSVDAAIRTSLNQPIDLNFDETPWRDVETFLEKELNINIVLTTSAIDDSLSEDEPLTFRLQGKLRGISARTALRLMLTPKNSTFVVQDNVVKIISLDDEQDSRLFTTHFINVRPLLARISELEKNRIGTPRIILEQSGGGKMAGGPAPGQKTLAGVVTAESMLIDLIQDSIATDEWMDSGQGLATIKIIGGFAVVNCQDSLADAIENFMQDLSFHLSRQ